MPAGTSPVGVRVGFVYTVGILFAASGEFDKPIHGPVNPLDVPDTTTLKGPKLNPAPIARYALCAVVPVL